MPLEVKIILGSCAAFVVAVLICLVVRGLREAKFEDEYRRAVAQLLKERDRADAAERRWAELVETTARRTAQENK